MKKNIGQFALIAGLTLLAGYAVAVPRTDYQITLVNESGENLQMTSASWSMGNFGPDDYLIPKHHTGKFSVKTGSDKRGQLQFTYSTGSTACQFEAGLEQKRASGWLIYSVETSQWAKAKSVGSFNAQCRATITKKAWGPGYNVHVVIK